MTFGKGERTYQWTISTLIGLLCLTFILTFLFVIGVSFATKDELVARNYFLLIPRQPTLEAYRRLFSNSRFLSSLTVSVLRCILGPLSAVFVSFFCAYILSFRRMPGVRPMTVFLLVTMLFPGGLIPSYLMITQLGLRDNFLVYILPGLVDVYGVLAMKVFIENIPRSMFESAEIDGASRLSMMFRITIPLAMPAVAAIFLFGVVAHWNSWYDAFLYVRDPSMQPFQLFLRSMLLINSGAELAKVFPDALTRIDNQTIRMASLTVSTIPMLILFPFVQKYFIHGVFTGAVKE